MGIEPLKYVLLGIVQGLTEFLPVSSSGHLVIFQTLLNAPYSIAFDTVVHLATGLAVVVYFGKDIFELLNPKSSSQIKKFLLYLIIGTIFTAIVGYTFKDYFESLFSSVNAVGSFLIVTAIIILLAEWIGKGRRQIESMNFWDAILIGLAQGCAIAPGLSRSGTTISAALGLNLDRTLAARFSFLLSIPAILGAGLLQAKDIFDAGASGIGFWPLFLGGISAFISGWLAIKIFMNIIQKTSLRGFAYYCFIAGLVVIIFL